MPGDAAPHDAWNPGLVSEIPRRLLPRVTLYRPENALTRYEEACAAADLCGRQPHEMAVLRFERLVVHEVLIRVTADLHVPDGPDYGALGVSLRGMAGRIIEDHVAPRMGTLSIAFDRYRAEVAGRVAALYDEGFRDDPVPVPRRRGPLARLLRRRPPPRPPTPAEPREARAVARWTRARAAAEGLDRACLDALLAVVGGHLGRHGRLMAARETLLQLANGWVCTRHGSAETGRMIAPIVAEAAAALGYRFLPHQTHPFILNVKGASAAGKSSIRPLQRELAGRLNLSWEDFALISPDYWRKFLLDYDSLGDDYKYAAMLTGAELEIIDRKLDRYMEEKAARGAVPHLLIDRFRFDSFRPEAPGRAGTTLLSRFGHTVYLFFIVTPPAEIVERAWVRGRQTGRYKAVDDLLDHSVEAYTGMPQLFFSWVRRQGQTVHFEFLDNGVPKGQRPRTVAYGWNGEMVVLDAACLRSLGRYRQLNIAAPSAAEVFAQGAGSSEAAEEDMLAQCVARLPRVDFADPATREVLCRTENGRCTYRREGLPPDFPALTDAAGAEVPAPLDLAGERRFTIGAWGAA